MSLPPILQGLALPVIGSPMFIVSGPELVIAQCKAGIIGTFPALNARPAEMLEKWIVRIKLELDEYQKANPDKICLLYTSPSPRDKRQSRMPSSA